MDANHDERTINSDIASADLFQCLPILMVEGQFGSLHKIIEAEIKLRVVHGAVVHILVIDLEELRRIAQQEKDVALHTQSHREIVHILGVLSHRNSLTGPFERTVRLFQTEHVGEIQIGAHRELIIAIAHLVERLQEIGLRLDLIVAGTIDVAKESCRQIEIVFGIVVTHFAIEKLCKLDGLVDLIMTKGIEAFVAQQLVIEHHIALVAEFLLVFLDKLIKLRGRAVFEEMAELVIPHPIFARQIGNGLFGKYSSC